VQRLAGRLSFICDIRTRSKPPKEPGSTSKENGQYWQLLQKFVFVYGFVQNRLATVLTEGPSDIMHIKNAIKENPNWAPSIYDTQNDRFLVRFFPHSGSHAAALGFNGGTGNYSLRTHPVIIVCDNDDGSKNLFKRLSGLHKMNINATDGVTARKLQHHLYLCKTPQAGGKILTTIEHLLPSALLALTIQGKTFEADSDRFDSQRHYGKTALARHLGRYHRAAAYIHFEDFIKSLNSCVDMSAP
jgi:hypothetical protein